MPDYLSRLVNDKHDEGVLSLNVMLGTGKKKLCGGRLSYSSELRNALHFFVISMCFALKNIEAEIAEIVTILSRNIQISPVTKIAD